MQFYLKPVGGIRCLFTVLNSNGHPVYEVTGKMTTFGCRLFLLDETRQPVGRISGVRFSNYVKYSVSAGGKKVQMILNESFSRSPVRIVGKRWYFRGSLVTHSFDILDDAAQTVMTHGKCWGMEGDCYAVEILNLGNVPLCLCLAALLDCTVSGGCAAPVLAGG